MKPHPIQDKETTVDITVDESRCIGSGNCAFTAPDLFDQREEDGVAVVLDRSPAVERHEAAQRAAGQCPADAIMVGA